MGREQCEEYGVIEGARIRLRALESDDMEAMWRWQNDWTTQRLGDESPELALSHDAVQRTFGPDSGFNTYIIETLDGSVIGNCGFYNYSGRNRHCSVGIWIGEAEARGRGYGTEALRLLLGYLFQQMGLHRVALTVVADNAQAIASYKKCGFREEGREREAVFKDGGWVDMLLMAVLEHEIIEAKPHGGQPGD